MEGWAVGGTGRPSTLARLPPLNSAGPLQGVTEDSPGLLRTRRLLIHPDRQCSGGRGNCTFQGAALGTSRGRSVTAGLPPTSRPLPPRSSVAGAAVASAVWPSSSGQRWSSMRLLWNLLSRSKKHSSSADGALGIHCAGTGGSALSPVLGPQPPGVPLSWVTVSTLPGTLVLDSALLAP